MKWFVRIAYTVLMIVFLFSGYSYISENFFQASDDDGESVQAMPVENQKPEVETTRLSLEEEFPRIKKIKESAKKLNEKFNGIIPAKLTIPAIKVNTDIEQVGTLPSGQMGVPANINNAAWYEPGTKPGNTGNSVIDGHVDSKTGPAVFYNLKKLQTGDEIIVTDKNGTALTYIVKNKVSYPRDKAPLEKIFGYTDGRKLNLITCTGLFNRNQHTHEQRLVVYTELKTDEVKQIEQKVDRPDQPTNVKVTGNFISWYAVRNENVVGYRVYRGTKDNKFKQIASISAFERKNYTDKNASKYEYYVTSVDQYGQESKPSEIVQGDHRGK